MSNISVPAASFVQADGKRVGTGVGDFDGRPVGVTVGDVVGDSDGDTEPWTQE